MKKFNVNNLDVKLLSIFRAVYEQGSVTTAADKLELSQPLVSHALDRLRQAFADPLFVRAGRSITPTARAKEIAPQIDTIIEQLTILTQPQEIDKSQLNVRFSVAANDFERRLIAPQLLSQLLIQAPNASLSLSHTSGSLVNKLRSREWDVVLTPLEAPNLADFYSEDLFSERFVCFYDQNCISGEDIQRSYAGQLHAIVRFAGDPINAIDRLLEHHDLRRTVKVVAPSFESLPDLIRGTPLVATLPSRLKDSVFREFAWVEFPLESPQLDFKMLWHKTTHHSPHYRWLRELIRTHAGEIRGRT